MKQIIRIIKGFALVATAVVCLMPATADAVSGSDWRAGRIIDDATFYNKSSMSIGQIQSFLNSKVPTCDNWATKSGRRAYIDSHNIKLPLTCLKDYQENPSNHENNLEGRSVPGGAKGSAQIIWDAAQQYNINPQVLI